MTVDELLRELTALKDVHPSVGDLEVTVEGYELDARLIHAADGRGALELSSPLLRHVLEEVVW